MTDRTPQSQLFFAGDRFATEATGIRIVKADDNYARCVLEIKGKHKNANGIVMGGAIFTLADFTFAVATNSDPDTMTVSLNSQIQYLRAAKEGCLTSESRVLRMGRSSCVLEIDITDDEGRLIAKATITGMVTRKPQ
ncbi:MAG: PaaI family thioesterase [Firmicutes bacterium]|nr:PaaI family thioesterase [Bacillota bacterium]